MATEKLFDQQKPFVITKGVKTNIDSRLITEMVESIMRMKKTVKVDYLQVFCITQEGDTTRIIHKQEYPEHKKKLLFKNNKNTYEGKVYIIDDGPYITVLLAEEY